MRGINIQEQWAQRIYACLKTIEARKYPLKRYKDELLWLIETPDKPNSGKRRRTEITGVVRFGNDAEFSDYEEWRRDADKHCVPEGSTFDWNLSSKMFGWQITEVHKLRTPVQAPEKRGMIGCKAVERDVVYMNADLQQAR